jgi:hypothetical protein
MGDKKDKIPKKMNLRKNSSILEIEIEKEK